MPHLKFKPRLKLFKFALSSFQQGFSKEKPDKFVSPLTPPPSSLGCRKTVLIFLKIQYESLEDPIWLFILTSKEKINTVLNQEKSESQNWKKNFPRKMRYFKSSMQWCFCRKTKHSFLTSFPPSSHRFFCFAYLSVLTSYFPVCCSDVQLLS